MSAWLKYVPENLPGVKSYTSKSMMAPSSKLEMVKMYLGQKNVKFGSSNIGSKYEITRGRELTRQYFHKKQTVAVTKISRT